jgi:isopenicillin N synthase-like dioxygenase
VVNWRTAGAGDQRLSARHRASRGVAAADQQRLSIAFFLGAQLDAVVPVYTLPTSWREALGPDSDPQNPLLREVGWNYLKGRLRSIRMWRNATIRTCFANAPSN